MTEQTEQRLDLAGYRHHVPMGSADWMEILRRGTGKRGLTLPAVREVRPEPRSIEEAERDVIARAIREKGEKTWGEVAGELGISKKTLWEKRKKYGFDVEETGRRGSATMQYSDDEVRAALDLLDETDDLSQVTIELDRRGWSRLPAHSTILRWKNEYDLT